MKFRESFLHLKAVVFNENKPFHIMLYYFYNNKKMLRILKYMLDK